MFSTRLPARLQPNAVSEAASRARAAGSVRFDLTETNPTLVGLSYPEALTGLLSDPEGLTYHPSPLGLLEARAAVARSCRTDAGVRADRLMLTASTSEAYSFLFKLLCDPGDEVLVPRPGYPLFDLLTALDDVRPVPYRLESAGRWCLDRDSVTRALTPLTRAILIVSPGNPTGAILRGADREWLVEIAAAHRLVLVADEVFADYRLRPVAGSTSLDGEDRVLTFTLGGLSKSAGLPQMKLAWTHVSGPSGTVEDAMARLEVIADSYLSVSTPIQLAAGRLLTVGAEIRTGIQRRLEQNLHSLREAVRREPSLTLHEPEGGWSAVLRVPDILSEEQLVLRLLEEHAVLVHPGYFFDMETGVHVVISLLPSPDVFDSGIARLARFAAGRTS